MENLFATTSMAEGYARARPAIHPWVVERVRELLSLSEELPRALDVGCGAGLSTAPLGRVARECLGIEPAAPMLRWGASVAPDARFAVANAEALPVRSRSMGLITAAGSLNYVDLDRFFPEALRVLAPGGVLVVYDFGQGRSFRGSSALAGWFSRFEALYPLPPGLARALSPDILSSLDSGFRLRDREDFETSLAYAAESYLEYVMSESNVPHAVHNGASEKEIRAWGAETLARVFGGATREVVFTGYIACLIPR